MNKTRQLLIEEFINSLNEEKIPWIKDWSDSLSPRSGITNKPYRGTNKLLLSYIASKKGYKDPRWLTFNQIKDTSKKYHPKEKWHLKKGSKATPIEYWYIYDNLNKLSYNLDEYKEKVEADPKIEIHCRLCCKTYLVFNAEEIEGIPALELNINNNINRDEFLQNIIKNMNVKFQELGSRAFYVPSDDIVTVPPKQIFKDSYAFHSTVLHELAHATGHISRLSRDMSGKFGSPNYAKEELRAEIGASFLMQDLNIQYDQSHIDNHKAYIQSWINVLQNDPEELFKAIKDAEKIADYLKEKGEISIGLTKNNEHKNNISAPKKSIAQRMEDAKNNTAKETKYSKKIYTRTSGIER